MLDYTVDNLLEQVRTQIDEQNTTNITDAHIVQALNRAQRKATNITVRTYDELFWTSTSTTTVGGQRDYDLPLNIYGNRIEKIEIFQGEVAWEIRKMANHDRTQFITASQVTRPYYYTQRKNKIQLYPRPAAGLQLEIHYTAAPERLVEAQGRIIDSTTQTSPLKDYVLVDALGDDLSTVADDLSSYVNIIDYRDGSIKATLQIAEINTELKQISFKKSGLTRTTVLGRTVTTDLPADIAADDYIATVAGTCVPELPEAYGDYLIQYAVVELRRRLGEPLQEELIHLQSMEDELVKMWVGRESQNRVRKSSAYWSSSLGSNLRRLLS